MVESAWFRGEGGGLHRFDLPLPDVYAEQERKGQLVRVDPPAPVVAPVPARVVGQVPPAEPVADEDLGSLLERPARSDSKADWIAYALQVSDLSADGASALTKAELTERFG